MQKENDISCKKIGGCIRKIRIQKGISQIELAKAIDVSQTHMSNIENGNTGLSLWTAVKIARALDCSIDQFADEDRYDGSDKQNLDKRNPKYVIDLDDLADALKFIAHRNEK